MEPASKLRRLRSKVDRVRWGKEKGMSRAARATRDTERARSYLGPRETVRAAVWGFTSVLGGELGYGKGRVVVVTEETIYVFESGFLATAFALRRIPQPLRLVASHKIGTVPVRARGSWLWVGDEKVVAYQLPGRGTKHILAALAWREVNDAANP
jgi:hypothetical protein